jgi:membrane complex biogenesis BtpA family protein
MKKKLYGVIHLPALAGAPGANKLSAAQALERAGTWAITEAQIFQRLGYDGVILENFGDIPFYSTRVPAETIVSMAVIAAAVREVLRIELGINILRNDADSALCIASVVKADFIRVNVLSGVVASDQGFIQGDAATLLRKKSGLKSNVSIFADVFVKHAKTLNSDQIEIAIEEVAGRGGADAVLLTGSTTGRPIDLVTLQKAFSHKPKKLPLYLASGMTLEHLENYAKSCDGMIIGSTLRKNGLAGAPLDRKRTSDFIKRFRKLK